MINLLLECRPFREALSRTRMATAVIREDGWAKVHEFASVLEDTMADMLPPATLRDGAETCEPSGRTLLISRAIRPLKLLRAVRSLSPPFLDSGQHDAHEFLSFTVETLCGWNSVQSSVKSNAFVDSLSRDATTRRTRLGQLRAMMSDGATSSATNMRAVFSGTFVRSTVCLRCECGASREEQFSALILYDLNESVCDGLARLLSSSSYLRGENKYYCDSSCMSLVEATQTVRVSCLPPVLLVHFVSPLGGLPHHPTRVGQRVVVDAVIDLHRFCSKDDGTATYTLMSFIAHKGVSGSGHFVTITRVANACHGDSSWWWLCDDEHVSPVSWCSVLEELSRDMMPYILLFERACDNGYRLSSSMT